MHAGSGLMWLSVGPGPILSFAALEGLSCFFGL